MLCALSISFECLSELLLLLEQISIIVVNSIKKSYISNVRILQMADFIESNFLHEQVEAIRELAGHITNLERVGNGLGVYQFDKLTLGGSD